MSLFGGGGDDGSAELRRQDEERKARIREGTNAINRIFGGKSTRLDPVYETRYIFDPAAGGNLDPRQPRPSNAGQPYQAQIGTTEVAEEIPGQFTDDYFANMEKQYADYYLPQLQRQERAADRGLRINLARSGNLTGTVGARKIGELEEDKATARRGVIDSSIRYGAEGRKKIEDTRGNLIGQLEAGSGIENVGNQARAAAEAATAPPAFSPLGDLFKNYTAAVLNSSVAAGNPGAFPGADEYRRKLLFNIPSPGGSSGSSTTVN